MKKDKDNNQEISKDNNQEISNISYIDIKKNFRNKGYTLEQLCIDETSEIVTTFSLAKGAIGTVADLRCPARYKIFILGRNQLPEDLDTNTAHTIKVRFADSNNNEISPDTRIRISIVKTSEAIITVANMLYKDITITDYQKDGTSKMKSDDKWYRFNQSILVNGSDHMRMEVINPDKTIDAKNVKLSLDIDFWEEESYKG